jgi:dTDP-4-amino-4,6-dideoxygalactose transaminase
MGLVKLPKSSISMFMNIAPEILESGNLAEGSWTDKLAWVIKHLFHHSHAIPTSSNGTGVLAVLQSIKEMSGKKVSVLLQANTMYGMYTTINTAGCEIVDYVDVDSSILMPRLDNIKEAWERVVRLSDSEYVLFLSHIGGLVNPEIYQIALWCLENDIKLIEDCAHTVGSYVDFGPPTNGQKYAGGFGYAGIYSFYSTKSVPAGEGGCIVTHDHQLAEYLQRYVKYDRFERSMKYGLNIRMSEINALLVYSVIQQTSNIIDNKARIAALYEDICDNANIPYIGSKWGEYDILCVSNNYKFTITMDGAREKFSTVTSPVYDYTVAPEVYHKYLPGTLKTISTHVYLPIWYKQDGELTEKAVNELLSVAAELGVY